jgi:hypothetical protein
MTLKKLLLASLAVSAGSAIACAPCDNSCSTGTTCNSPTHGKTYFHAREAGQDEALRLMGVADKMHLTTKECDWYSTLAITLGYERSFKPSKLGEYFSFNPCGCTLFSADTTLPNPVTVATGQDASQAAADGLSNARSSDWGLPVNYKSTLCFNPRIDKFKIDFDLFLGLNNFIDGLWMRIMAPCVWARYDLHPCEVTATASTTQYLINYVGNDALMNPPYQTIVQAWNDLGAYGQVQASNKGKLRNGSASRFRLASLDLELGYDLIRNECAQLGLFIYGIAPTANRVDATYLFSPVAGTYNWQLGGGINGTWRIWNRCDTQKLNLFGEIVMTHMFKRSQERLHGLNVNGGTAGNSWLLLKKFSAATPNVSANQIIRATDALARCIKVSNSFMMDAALMLQYKHCAFDFSLGYNFWYRSKDKTNCCDSTCNTSCPSSCNSGCTTTTFAANTYGIKSVAYTDTAWEDADLVDYHDTFYKKSDSDIKKSGTAVNPTPDDDKIGIQSVATDYVLESDVTADVALAPRAHSNKIFGYMGYNWQDSCYAPFLGLGAMCEWGQSNRVASQWGVYLKGGFNF